MSTVLESRLATFAKKNSFRGKSASCVALVVTRHAQREGLPLDPESLLTESTGQVSGLGKAPVQAILKQHGIERVLAEEGGRTSRGSVGRMRDYVAFLNALDEDAIIDLPTIEKLVDRARSGILGCATIPSGLRYLEVAASNFPGPLEAGRETTAADPRCNVCRNRNSAPRRG